MIGTQSDERSNAKSLSYIHKNAITCPVCTTKIYREELLTGRGRLIAGDLTPELNRLYEASEQFGEVYPLIYSVTSCPQCYFSAQREDFHKLPAASLRKAKSEREKRIEWIGEIARDLPNFHRKRTIESGMFSHILAMYCYDYYTDESSPIIKQGIASLRAAWLAGVLHGHKPKEHYDTLADTLYRKAWYFYTTAIESENSGEQSMAGCPHLGPDLDKNYAFDGVLYVYGYLELHYGPRKNRIHRENSIIKAKQIVSRIFGMGRATKEKPTALLELARNLHNDLTDELDSMKKHRASH